jgi:hypothetical protein
MFEQPVPGARHTMQHTRTFTSGAEEWQCPTCGRSFVVQWPPNYKRIILEPGDEMAAHAGGKGGIQMGALQVRSGEGPVAAPEQAPTPEHDPDDAAPFDERHLGPWLKWFHDEGLKDKDEDGTS